MPRGWYLAQGLIPLVPSDSDDEEGPCELPNGRLVCGPHGLVVCHKCCSDYSFMDDVLRDAGEDDEDDEEDEAHYESFNTGSRIEDLLGPKKRRGTGQVIPTKFTPPSTSIRPTELFHGQKTYGKLTR